MSTSEWVLIILYILILIISIILMVVYYTMANHASLINDNLNKVGYNNLATSFTISTVILLLMGGAYALWRPKVV